MAKITLVDDDENIVTSVSLALESHGHVVKAYYDGASGLAALESDPPDLVILDVKMPRMDGMEVLRRLRAFAAQKVAARRRLQLTEVMLGRTARGTAAIAAITFGSVMPTSRSCSTIRSRASVFDVGMGRPPGGEPVSVSH